MDNFVVSARKYRPQTFDTVVGQESITRTLKNAIKSNHLAQAFLFCGPRGVGKTTCARILAKTINCFNPSENLEACNECESCTSFNNNASFNIHELDAASNNSVEDIRNLVDQVRIPPQVGKYKVYIIDEVHMLSSAAFNAFLKTLEEPPAYAKFILATTEKHKIIPTILSRCQIYDFKRITVEDISSHLSYVSGKEGVTAEQDALHIIAQKSDGALRDALSIFDQIISFSGKNITYKNVIENLNVLDYDYYFKLVDAIQQGDIVSTLIIINDIIDNGFDGQHFLIGFGEHLRNLLVGKDPQTINLLEVGGSIRQRYLEQSRSCSIEFLLKALDLANRCDIEYKSSNNKKLHLELALMQMCSLSRPGYVTDTKAPATSEKKTKTIPKPQPEKPLEKPVPLKPADTREKVEKPTTRPVAPKIAVPGTVSIKNHRKEEKKKESEQEEDLTGKPADAFDQEKLNGIWKSLADQYKTVKSLYATLIRRQPEIRENHQIIFTVDNKIQKTEFDDRKMEILPVLREKLDNYQIMLEVDVNELEGEKKPYTPQEKFNKMVAKNPALKKLKDQLDLEIDF